MLPKWHDITCECGSTRFQDTFAFRWHPTGGTSKADEQVRCIECGMNVDMRKARDLHHLAQRRAELKQMEHDLGLQREHDLGLQPTSDSAPSSDC